MSIYSDIASQAGFNDDYRRVLRTGEFSQLVLMNLEPGTEIGEEVHDDVDQIIVFVSGTGEVSLDGDTTPVAGGDLVYIAAGVRHNVVNTGDEQMKLYTVYAPPEHPDGTVHHTKAEGDAAHH
jgi:mannose-6-phosphate isomerase-like protein (cupin superfamily)